MKKLLGILALILVLLTSNANAGIGAFIDYSDTNARGLAIKDGDSVSFKVNLDTNESSIFIDHISLRDIDYNLVFYFEDDLTINSKSYSKEYTISKEQYKTPGNYKIIVAAKSTSGVSVTEELGLVVEAKPTEPEEPQEPGEEPTEPVQEPGEEPTEQTCEGVNWPPIQTIQGDLNYDGVVDFKDFLIFAGKGYGTKLGEADYNMESDLDRDCKIGFSDFLIFLRNYQKTSGLTLRFLNKDKQEISNINLKENEEFYVGVYAEKENEIGLLDFDYESNLPLERLDGIYNDKGEMLQQVLHGKTNFETVQHPDKEKEFYIKVWSTTVDRKRIERTLKVNIEDVNRNPAIKNIEGPSKVKEGETIKFTINAEDADKDSLSYITGNRFTVEDNVLSWQTGFEDAGDYDILLIVSDGFNGNISQNLIFKVEDSNRAPTLDVPSEIRTKEAQEVYNYPSNQDRYKSNKVDFEVSGSDKDGDGVSIEAINLPKGASFNAQTGKFIWNVRRNQGTYTAELFPERANRTFSYEIKFRASDGKATTEKVVKIYVEDNVYPYYPDFFGQETSPSAGLGYLIGSTLTGDGKAWVKISGLNSEDKQDFNNELSYRYTINSVVGEWKEDVTKSETNLYLGEEFFKGSDVGFVTVKLEVKDLNNMVGEDVKVIKVDKKGIGTVPPVTPSGANQRPAVSDIPDQTIVNGQNFATISLDNYVQDETPDNQIQWSVSGNTNLVVSINANRVVSISYPTNWIGSETITFSASDGSLTGSDSAKFTVNPTSQPGANQPPIVSNIPDQTIISGQSFSNINLNTFVSDETPDEQIFWSISGNNQLSVSIVNGVATISYPTTWTGSETVIFTAKDVQGATGSDSAVFRVNSATQPPQPGANQPPVVSNIPDQVIVSGGSFTSINLDDYVSDPDNADNQITWTITGNSQLNVAIVNRVVTISYPANWIGTENLVFTARDPNGAVGSDSAKFTVTNVIIPTISQKRTVNHIELGNVIINNWESVKKGSGFDIKVFVKNKGNIKQKDIKVSIDIPQLDQYERSTELSVKKGKEEIVSFSSFVPEDFSDNLIYVIVTAGNNKDEDAEVIGFLVE